jgi:hypothetical protein
MSHFSVIVVSPPSALPPGEDAISPLLAPYHEYECTGVDDQYVVDVDITDEARADYETDTTLMIKLADGSLTSPYTDKGDYKPEFVHTDTSGTIPERRLFVPPGCEKVDVPTKDVQSFVEYVRGYYEYELLYEGETANEKYGYIAVAGPLPKFPARRRAIDLGPDSGPTVLKVVKRTNPNAKWDWWVIGGRWSGHFTNTAGKQVNTVRKGDWALANALADASYKAGTRFDLVHAALAANPPVKSFKDLRDELGGVREKPEGYAEDAGPFDPIGHVREAYSTQPGIVAVKELDDPFATEDDKASYSKGKLLSFFDSVEDYMVPRDQYIASVAWSNVGSYAICDADGWHEKGKMGWWGISSDESADWPVKALEKISALPDDAWLTCVDAHI